MSKEMVVNQELVRLYNLYRSATGSTTGDAGSLTLAHCVLELKEALKKNDSVPYIPGRNISVKEADKMYPSGSISGGLGT